jgi:16S rRNA C967 or C1407 C5-methylase (RsmB/RsmF family)
VSSFAITLMRLGESASAGRQDAAAGTTAGGTLVYSVCTISRADSEEVIECFVVARGESEPRRNGGCFPPLADGFFNARLRGFRRVGARR